MLKLLLGMIAEVVVGVGLAGVVLAVAIPVLNRSGLIGIGDAAARVIIIGVIVLALAVALFRPGSAIHRYMKR